MAIIFVRSPPVLTYSPQTATLINGFGKDIDFPLRAFFPIY